MKADFWDGGHRVPFLIRWPGKVKAGSTNHGLTCLNDIYATLAEITDVTYPETEGVDSISFLPSLTGESGKHARTDVVHHSYMGLFAIRQGPWKLLCGPGSGGWGKPRPHEAIKQGKPMVQLYHMEKDLGESKNLHLEHPEKVKELRALLEKQIADGRTTPGPRQMNDVDQVVIDKMDKSKRKKKSGCQNLKSHRPKLMKIAALFLPFALLVSPLFAEKSPSTSSSSLPMISATKSFPSLAAPRRTSFPT